RASAQLPEGKAPSQTKGAALRWGSFEAVGAARERRCGGRRGDGWRDGCGDGWGGGARAGGGARGGRQRLSRRRGARAAPRRDRLRTRKGGAPRGIAAKMDQGFLEVERSHGFGRGWRALGRVSH